MDLNPSFQEGNFVQKERGECQTKVSRGHRPKDWQVVEELGQGAGVMWVQTLVLLV